jgi:phosphoribosylformylglycinamidine cyclo-ligase
MDRTKNGDLYAEDGVDVAEGDDFSAFAGRICRATFENSPFVDVVDVSGGHFRGPRAFRFVNLPDGWLMDAAPDGIGTKVVVIDAANAYTDACRDVIAMTASDITRWGGKPLVFVNVLDVATLGKKDDATNEAFRRMMIGLGDVAAEQGLVCFRGETAELGVCVGSENPDATTAFNWAGFMLGVYLPDRMITGESLAAGQAVVALKENGFRSNGISSVRGGLRRQYGESWFTDSEAARSLFQLAEPSILYDRFLCDANGWTYPVQKPQFHFHLLTHVSGGGIVGKFGEDMLFPRGLSADLFNLYDPPTAMRQVRIWRDMSVEECYRTFNCGNGMLAVLDKGEVSDFIEMAKSYRIEAQECGVITSGGEPTLSIHSKFEEVETLVYHP